MSAIGGIGNIALLASAARTADATSPAQTNRGGRGLLLLVDVTALAATPAVTPKLRVRDLKTGKQFVIWAATAAITDVTGTGLYAYLLAPGAAGTVSGDMKEQIGVQLPSDWDVFMDHGDTDSITYQVSAFILP